MPDVSTQSRPDYMGVTRIKPARNDGTAVTATAAGGSSCGGGGLGSGGRRGGDRRLLAITWAVDAFSPVLWAVWTPLSGLSRHPACGTDRGREALRRSLHTYGTGRSIVIDVRGRILGGHKTVEQAKHLGLPITVVPTTGQELVVVQRMDLDARTDPRARELALADNRVAELDLDWDPAVLRQLEQAGVALEAFWTPEEFARLLAGATPCLMVTDPPYGVNYQPAFRHQAYPRQRTAVGRVTNDTQADWAAAYALFPGDIAYVWHAALFADVVMAGLRQAEFEVRSQIVWAKPTFVLGRGAYHWQHEPAWYAVRQGRGAPWYGGRAQSTVWEVPKRRFLPTSVMRGSTKRTGRCWLGGTGMVFS